MRIKAIILIKFTALAVENGCALKILILIIKGVSSVVPVLERLREVSIKIKVIFKCHTQ